MPSPIDPDATPMVIIPLEEAADVMTIRLASLYVNDGNTHWLLTMPRFLAFYHLTPSDYWNLTVAEHEILEAALPKAKPDGG